MPVYVIDTLKPKNGLDFPVVEAVDVAVEGYASLADAVTHFATDTAIAAINTALDTKANISDVNSATASLQAQIDQIEISASAEAVVAPEVAGARVGADGTSYQTLKDRLDTESAGLQNAIISSKAMFDNKFGLFNYGYDKPFNREADPTYADSRRIGVRRSEEEVILNGDTVWPEVSSAKVWVRISGDVSTTIIEQTVREWTDPIQFVEGHNYRVTAELVSGESTLNNEEYINGVSVYKAGSASSIGNDYREGKKFFREFTADDSSYHVAIFIPTGQSFLNAKYIITIDDLSADSVPKSIVDLNSDVREISNNFDSLGVLSKIEYDSKTAGSCEYYGQKLDVAKRAYVPTKYMTFSKSSSQAIQGGATYGDYYIQFTDKQSSFIIINLKTQAVVQDTQLTAVQTYHCNNANFSDIFYDVNDIFPLLYVSMENIAEHKVLVYRLVGSIGEITLQLIQTITFDDPEICNCYYPNACIDNDNGLLIQIGYTENSYQKTDTNKLVFNIFNLPSASSSEVALSDNLKIDSFRLPSLHATQGAIVFDGKIYQVYGITDERWIKVIDIATGKIVTSINLNAQSIIDGEQETLFIWNDELYCVGFNLNIYKIATSTENYVPAKKVLIIPETMNGFSCAANTTNGAFIYHRPSDARSTIMTKKNAVNETFEMPLGDYTAMADYRYVDEAARQIMATYGLIKIPEGAKTVEVKMTNTDYYFGLVILYREKADKTQGKQVYDSGWKEGGTTVVKNLSDLDYDTYEYGLASTFKIGSAGTASFTNETVQSLGWSYEFTY